MLDNQSWGGGFERPVNWDSLCLCVAGHGIVLDWVWGFWWRGWIVLSYRELSFWLVLSLVRSLDAS